VILNSLRPVLCTFMVWLAFPLFGFGQNEPKLSEEEMKHFLLTANVVASKTTPKGITSPQRLTLNDGKITHDGGFQTIDDFKNRQEFPDGHVELNFRDSYKCNLAAYELAKLLGLGDMMPVTVERRWAGKTGSLTWWLPAVMDLVEMNKKKLKPPDVDAYNRQMYKKRVFSELVYDTDPNLTNVLVSADWHLWMIDFTRAFRPYKELHSPETITTSKCERQLLERLRKLTRNEVAEKVQAYLKKDDIDGIMARRDKIVKIFEGLIAKKGESAVLYDDPVVR